MHHLTHPRFEVTRAQAELISEFTQLRARAFAFDAALGADFARTAAAAWKERTFGGLANACYGLAFACSQVPGAYDVFAAARSLASRLARESN